MELAAGEAKAQPVAMFLFVAKGIQCSKLGSQKQILQWVVYKRFAPAMFEIAIHDSDMALFRFLMPLLDSA
jgi:hypothetical protein